MKTETVVEFEAGDGVEERFVGKRYRLTADGCGDTDEPEGCDRCARSADLRMGTL